MKNALITASLMLAVGSTAACGGGGGDGDSAPTDASKADFCTQFVKISAVTDGDSIKAWAKETADIGTPEELPDEAREGFELMMKEADNVDADATVDDLGDETKLSEAELEKITAFTTYFATNCAAEIAESMEDLVPSEDAS